MTGRSQGLLYLCLLIAVPTAVFILDLRYARSLGSGVSPSADPFSEANAVRAGINYQQDGFLRNAGLPNQGGTRYAIGVGFCFVVTAEQARAELVRAGGGEWETRPIAEVIEEYQKLAGEATVVIAESGSIECPDLVYTHYPPGPDYMVGLFLGLFPLDRLWLLRALPLTLTYVGEVWLLWELRKRFGGPLAAIAVGLVSICGAIRLFSHGLHNQGYASALLLVQIAAVLMGVRYWEARTARRLAVGGIATLAFLQGWLSFDFFFLVVLAALPFLLCERNLNKGTAVALLLVPFAAFSLAHALHFAQVAIYYGSITDAAADLLGSAVGRSFGHDADYVGPLPSPVALVLDYLRTYVFLPNKFFGWTLPAAMLGVVALVVWSDVRSAAQKEALRAFTTLLLALFVSSLWVFVMRQHSVVHTHLVPRHFLLLLIVALYVLAAMIQPFLGLLLQDWRIRWRLARGWLVARSTAGMSTTAGDP